MKKLMMVLVLLFVATGCGSRYRPCWKECDRVAAVEMDRLKDEKSRITDAMIEVRLERSQCKKECAYELDSDCEYE